MQAQQHNKLKRNPVERHYPVLSIMLRYIDQIKKKNQKTKNKTWQLWLLWSEKNYDCLLYFFFSNATFEIDWDSQHGKPSIWIKHMFQLKT